MSAHPIDYLDLTVVVYADKGVAHHVRIRYEPVSDGVAMPGYRGEVDLRDFSQDDELIARITLLLSQISGIVRSASTAAGALQKFRYSA